MKLRIAAAVTLATCLVQGGCRRGPTQQEAFVAKLTAAFHGLDREGSIAVRDLTEFGWDQLFTLGPYTTLERARSLMNVNEIPQTFADTALAWRDDITVLVFIKQGAVTRVFPISRAQLAIPEADTGPFGPADATLTRSRSGEKLVLATPALKVPRP